MLNSDNSNKNVSQYSDLSRPSNVTLNTVLKPIKKNTSYGALLSTGNQNLLDDSRPKLDRLKLPLGGKTSQANSLLP